MDNKDQVLIDSFLLGELTAHEEAKFLEKLEGEDNFKALYESSREEFEHMQLFAEGDLRKQMETWEKEEAVNPVDLPPKKFQLGKLILVLAVVVFALFVSFYVLKPKADPIILAQKYYQPDFSGMRVVEGDVFENVKYILEGKKESAYSGLKEALIQIPKSNDRYAEAQYFLGHLSYIQKDFNSAKQYFQTTIAYPNFKENAEWYYALSQLHLGEKDNYRLGLSNISKQNGHAFQNAAERFLVDLE